VGALLARWKKLDAPQKLYSAKPAVF